MHRDKTYSFADAITFVVMERLRLSDLVTFDAHFRQFGRFNILDGSDL